MAATRVYLLRHGDAGDKREWSGDDAQRPLSEIGEQRSHVCAEYFAKTGIAPSRVLTSPLVRARQTADILAATLGRETLVAEDSRLGPAFDMNAFREILAENVLEESLLLVGHDPSFSRVIAATIGGGTIVLKKGGLVRLDIDDIRKPRGSLVWLASPSLFGC
jgi:phosphohistidine phosphatase